MSGKFLTTHPLLKKITPEFSISKLKLTKLSTVLFLQHSLSTSFTRVY